MSSFRWTRVRAAAVAASALIVAVGCEPQGDRDVWEFTAWLGHSELPAQAATGRPVIYVRFDLQRFQSPLTTRIEFPLPDGTTLHLEKTGETVAANGGFVWRGKVEGDDKSMATFSIVEDVLVGDIVTSGGKMYQVDHIATGVQIIFELNPGSFPMEAQPLTAEEPIEPIPETPTSESSCAEDGADQIDVMVVYTQTACTAAHIANFGGCTATAKNVIEAKIQLAVDETNTTYANSDINQRISPVHVASVGVYAEADTLDMDLKRLKLPELAEKDKFNVPNGYLENVLLMRNQFRADAVVMITKPMNSYPNSVACGNATQMAVEEPWLEKDAFAVVPLDCAIGNFSFGHELGHVMGAGHDVDSAAASPALGPNSGLVNPDPSQETVAPWRTVMAENNSDCLEEDSTAGCIRLPYWSNPDETHHGDDMGTTEADNHQVLNDTADTVANFRRSSNCEDEAGNLDD